MKTAVLLSGGLDSAVLLAAETARHGDTIQPIYVSAGLAWEAAEQAAVRALLGAAPLRARTRALVSLAVDMRDVYDAGHWAIEGRPPGYHTPDAEVYLPGRNIVLLGKAGVYCAAAGIDRLVLGTLAHNPFPDATTAFRSAMAGALSLGLAHPLALDAPFALATKPEVVARGVALGVPFQLTLSCMRPLERVQRVQEVQGVQGVQGVRGEPLAPLEPLEPLEPLFLHCGTCSKCRERHEAFVAAAVADTTEYADRKHVGTGRIADC